MSENIIKDEKDKYELSLEAMLKAGVHFGHKKSHKNPKMDQYIYGVRNDISIIDLEKTLLFFEKALIKVEEVVKNSGVILIVGTKKQVKPLVKAVADKLNFPYVNERWLGGTFTNFDIIKKRLNFMLENQDLMEKNKLFNLTKLEKNKLQKKIDRIDFKMGGLKNMKKLPDLVFVLDINKDFLAIKEAKNQDIKTMGIADTNVDPTKVDYPIPANDDALSSLKYILGIFLKRILKINTNHA